MSQDSRVSIWVWLIRGAIIAAAGIAIRQRRFWRWDGGATSYDAFMAGLLHVALLLPLIALGWWAVDVIRRRLDN